MYVFPNFKTKKALKEAVRDGGISVAVFQPGPFGSGNVENGTFAVEGPHSPEPHRWYAQVLVIEGKVVEVA